MKVEYNDPSVMMYYKATVDHSTCKSYFFNANEPIACEALPQYATVFSLFSSTVSAINKRIPFPDVMNHNFGWRNAVCLRESLLKDTSQRTGLFLLHKDTVKDALRLLPQYAYSIAFFAGTVCTEKLLESLGKDLLSVLDSPPGLWEIAADANAVLIHCINGWDGYSVNYISRRETLNEQGDGSVIDHHHS